MVSIAKRLHDLREDHDETQKQLAAYMKLPPARISEWERGVYTPSIDALIVIADHYKVSLDYLAGVTDNPKRA
jgi:transcriptional regulator with XRE-family HTH domain